MMNILKETEYDDQYIINILQRTKTIAIIGLSSNWNRPSYFVAKYLIDRGYKIFPVNPHQKGNTILGKEVFSSLEEIKETIDMVDIFRSGKEVLGLVKEALKIKAKTIWMQIGVSNKEAEKLCKRKGVEIVMNRCPKIEYCRLSGELGWAGINSGLFHNKRRIIKPIYNF